MIPTGYSFNLDGTCIYLTMAALFLAQATGTDLTLAHQLGIVGILLLTSKGAAGVTGSGFIVLAATLASVGTIPVASDRAHSGRRPLHVGSARAHQPDRQRRRDRRGLEMGRRARCRRMRAHLNNETEAEASVPEQVLVEDDIAPAGPPKPVR